MNVHHPVVRHSKQPNVHQPVHPFLHHLGKTTVHQAVLPDVHQPFSAIVRHPEQANAHQPIHPLAHQSIPPNVRTPKLHSTKIQIYGHKNNKSLQQVIASRSLLPINTKRTLIQGSNLNDESLSGNGGAYFNANFITTPNRRQSTHHIPHYASEYMLGVNNRRLNTAMSNVHRRMQNDKTISDQFATMLDKSNIPRQHIGDQHKAISISSPTIPGRRYYRNRYSNRQTDLTKNEKRLLRILVKYLSQNDVIKLREMYSRAGNSPPFRTLYNTLVSELHSSAAAMNARSIPVFPMWNIHPVSYEILNGIDKIRVASRLNISRSPIYVRRNIGKNSARNIKRLASRKRYKYGSGK